MRDAIAHRETKTPQQSNSARCLEATENYNIIMQRNEGIHTD
jgi:hypothetical protein